MGCAGIFHRSHPFPLLLAAPSLCPSQGCHPGPQWLCPPPGAGLGSGMGWPPASLVPLSPGIIFQRI